MRDLAIVLGAIEAIWIAFVLFGHHIGMRASSPQGPLVAALVMALIMASAFPLLALCGQLGCTVIDARGVTMKRCMRQPLRLEWEDVRRLRWLTKVVVLQGDRVTIQFAWQHARSTGDDERGKAALRKHLGPHFDLSETPKKLEWSWLSLWRVVMLASTLGLLAYLAYRQALANPAQAWLWMVLLMGAMLIGYVWVVALLIRRVHSNSDSPARWRTRLA